jgi:Tfp pilus assembly protein PilN
MSNPFRPVSPASSSFLPEDYIARKTETRVNVLILVLFALVLGGIAAAFMVTNRHWKEIRERQTNVNEQWAVEGAKMDELKKLEDQRAQMMEKAQITAALVERVPRWAVLGEVTLRRPLEMRFDILTIKSNRTEPAAAATVKGAPPAPAAPMFKNLTDKITGTTAAPEKPKVRAPTFTYTLTVDGSTAKNTDVADFLASLKASPIFTNVELAFIRETKEKDRELRKFQITANIRTDADTAKLAESLKKLITERTAQMDTDKGQTPAGPEPLTGPQPATAEVPETPKGVN